MCYTSLVPYYERRLPHWQPDGAALFVTWRLHGSLPQSFHSFQDQPAGRAFVAMDRELDRAFHGPCWLKDDRVAHCVIDTFRYGEKQLGLYEARSWVLMSNHVHILLYPKTELAKITKTIKGFSARQANAILDRRGQPFWQNESYDHWVRDRVELEKVVRYIEGNPVSAGLVNRPDDWPWSSAHEPVF